MIRFCTLVSTVFEYREESGGVIHIIFSPSPSPPAIPAVNLPGPLTVLILGDSLSLCGFGKSLDQRFRGDLQVKAAFTYMACGTIAVSWLKQKPFTHVKTYCGFWSIESVPGAAKPKEFQDTYGMRRGSRPKPHPVPKLDDLLSTIRPEILIMQTGNNIFSLFRDGKTVLPARQGPILKSLIAPFISEALKAPSTLQKIYWVASPTSGRVSKEVQDFVVEQVRLLSAGTVTVIDSRPLVSRNNAASSLRVPGVKRVELSASCASFSREIF